MSKKNHASIQRQTASSPGVTSRVRASGGKCRPHREKTTRVSRNAVRRQIIPGKGSVRVASSPGRKNFEERCLARVATNQATRTQGVPMESARVVSQNAAMVIVAR